jgi:hypothetical protein
LTFEFGTEGFDATSIGIATRRAVYEVTRDLAAWAERTSGTVEVEPRPVTPVVSDVDSGLPHTRRVNEQGVAVVVGTQTYKQAPRAQYACADAQAVRKYLTTAFGYQEGNIIDLPDPTKGQLEEVFGSAGSYKGKLYNWVKPGKSDVFVYYAGHGAPSMSDKKGYLVPVDASPDYVSASGYPLDLLYANLAKIPAKSITVVLDACFSGLAADTGGRSTMLLKDASPLVVAPVSENVPSKLSVFAAATGSQLASWYPEKGHSLFTYWYLKGLKGEADADKDGSITLGEMKAYLSENVTYTARRLYGRDQTPEVKGRPDAELLRLR